jgi:hypothetical protein
MHVGSPTKGAHLEFFRRTLGAAERLGFDNVRLSGHVVENRHRRSIYSFSLAADSCSVPARLESR